MPYILNCNVSEFYRLSPLVKTNGIDSFASSCFSWIINEIGEYLSKLLFLSFKYNIIAFGFR